MNRLTASVVSVLFCCVAMVLLVAVSAFPGVAVAADAVADSGSAGVIAAVLSAAPDWLQAITLLIGGASAIAALTPTPKDDGVLLVLRKVVDFLALNILGAKNAQPDKTVKSGR